LRYLKRQVILLVVLFLTVLPCVSADIGETLVYVDPQISHAALGSTFEVNVSIANVRGLYAYEFKLYYNTNLLDGVEVRLPKGHFLEPVDPVKIWICKLEIDDDFNSTHGRVWVAVGLFCPETGNYGSGALATITFRVINSGSCTLDLCKEDKLDRVILVNKNAEEMAFEVRGGYFDCDTEEHEIVVFLEVPSHLIPGESANINVAVQNGGQSDETNVLLQLLINGNVVNSTEINLLPVSSSENLSFRWRSLDEAKYNVTAYAPSLTGENSVLNNLESKMVLVSHVIQVPMHFLTIQEAIQAANLGDTIHVSPGTYYEHVVINKAVTLAGENMTNTIIDGSGTWRVVQIRKSWMYGCMMQVGKVTARISGFTIQNGFVGVHVESNDNTIEDNIIKNCDYGVYLFQDVERNVIRRNTITTNECGIICDWGTRDNMVYHNNFINNTGQAVNKGKTTWNYIDKGNYWSDYNGTDADKDNIGDYSYEINATQGARDASPLMSKYACVLGDLNDDGGIDVLDLDIAAASFRSFPRHPQWNPAADINIDGKVNIIDIALIAKTSEKHSDVNDVLSPIDAFELLAPWIGTASLIILITVAIVYVKHRGRQSPEELTEPEVHV